MSDSSPSLSHDESMDYDDSDSISDILPDETILDKFADYKLDLEQLEKDEIKDIAHIDFSKKFMIAFALFQEALRLDEKSERTLDLTKKCIVLNPANYTVWYFRRIILFELKKDLNEEIDFINEIIAENQKNYQIWQHRKCIVKRLNDASKEKEVTRHILMNDSKNYHAWQYRQWFVNKFNLFDGEIEYTTKLLLDDLRNNSAWNHRYFVMDKLGIFKDKTSDEFKKEVEFVIEKIKIAPNNESSWNYLIGILGDQNLNDNEIVNKFIDDYEKNDQIYSVSPFFYSFKLDQIMLKLEKNSDEQLIKQALDLADSLATTYDKIREKYWNYITLTIQKKYLNKT